jgi:hypothetical protein
MINSSSQILFRPTLAEMTRTSHTMRSGEYGFDYIKNVYGRTAIKAKAAQKTNVIFAICNGRATMRRETLRIPRRR